MEQAPEGNTRRLDVVLVERGLQPSRERAKEAILSGHVSVNGKIAGKPSQLIAENDRVICRLPPPRYVGRGGEKLEKALDISGIDVQGVLALDVGASTGGFTDCLLQHGAAEVFAVDVGQGQLHPSLRRDPRVRFLEKTDIRDTHRISEWLQGRHPDFCTVDVSFISLEQVGNAVLTLLAPQACVVWLVKPQFEAGRSAVGKKGIVRYKDDHVRVLENVCRFFRSQDCRIRWLTHSPITGGEGNIEYLMVLQKSGGAAEEAWDIRLVVDAAWRELRHTN